jgi:hypothetical protein
MHKMSEHRQEVRQAGRVLERHGPVRVEEPAAVRAELLDRLLGGDRVRGGSSGASPFNTSWMCAGPAQGLDRPLGHEDDGDDEGDRQQDVQGSRGSRSTQKLPIVFEPLRDESTDQRHRHGDAHRRR